MCCDTFVLSSVQGNVRADAPSGFAAAFAPRQAGDAAQPPGTALRAYRPSRRMNIERGKGQVHVPNRTRQVPAPRSAMGSVQVGRNVNSLKEHHRSNFLNMLPLIIVGPIFSVIVQSSFNAFFSSILPGFLGFQPGCQWLLGV